MNVNKNDIIGVLKQCFDPEIPIDLWNLGLIYDIKINEENVDITMSLTTPGCTMGDYMSQDIKIKLKSKGISNVNIKVVFDPPWQPEMMTDYAREKLGFKPPQKNEIQSDKNKNWE